MKKLLALFATLILLFSLSAFAEPVARSPDGGAVVTVHLKEPCIIPSVLTVFEQAGIKEDVRAADVVLDGQAIKACFAVDEESGVVLLLLEDGRPGVIPMEMFNEEVAI